MRKVKILLAVVALALAACSGGSEPAEITVSDAETGSAEEVSVETESSEETITTDTDEPEKEEGESEQAEVEDEPVQPTPTAESTPTVEPTPPLPEPTEEPVDEETRERAGQVYSMLVMAQATAELLNETAGKSQEGELEGFEWFGTTIVIGAFGTAIDEAQAEIDPPEPLKSLTEDTFKLNGMVGDILGRWYNEEIYADDVILELEPILFHLEDVISSAELVMAEEYGADASELAQLRQEMVDELSASLDSSGEDDSSMKSEMSDVENSPATIVVTDEYIEISGVGPSVSENFELDACYKGVFYSSTDGDVYPIINLHSIEDSTYDDVTRGEGVRQIELEGGTYFIEADVDDGTEWFIRGECQSTNEQLSEVAPAPEPMTQVFLELDGIGPVVSENFALGSCYKGVFYSSVEGDDYPIINLHSIEDGRYDDITRGEEERHIELEGGTYFVEANVENGTEWSIRGECQSTNEQLSEVAPAPEPMPQIFLELDGVGPAVSDNFALKSCYKGVFYSSVEGDDYPIINLHSIEDGRYDDITRGEEARHIELEGGTYFVEANVENGTEWSIRAECQSTDQQLAEIEPAPEAMPEIFLELEGVGSAVSENFALGNCYKGVFYSSIEGDDYPIINVHHIEDGSYDGIARGEEVDHVDIEEGSYFIEVSVENGTEWSVRGECQSTDSSAVPAEPAASDTQPSPEVLAASDGKVCDGAYLLDVYIVLDNAGMTDSIPLQTRSVDDARAMLEGCQPNLDYDAFVERLDVYAAVLSGDEIMGDFGTLTPEDALMDVAFITINAVERE